MASMFLMLSGVLWMLGNQIPGWLPVLFLVLYGSFFFWNGANQMGLFTLQGKLIRANRRGRLLTLASFCGSVPAIGCAVWLLPQWLSLPDGGGYVPIFAFTGCCFLVAALVTIFVIEPADKRQLVAAAWHQHLAGAWDAVRHDANLRRLCGVAMLFSTVLILFPHYQAMARDRLGLTDVNLMYWVVAQNTGTGLSSLVVGPLGDRRGNRLTLALLLLSATAAPLLAVAVAQLSLNLGQKLFWLVFFLIGLTPMIQRTFQHYTLEICPPERRLQYLAALNVALVSPFIFSPAVGWLTDHTSFELVMLLGAALILLSSLLSCTLREPRHA